MGDDKTWTAQPDWKDKREFYAQTVSYLALMKDAWRNYTAHGRSRYSEEDAQLLYDNAKAFFKNAATRLSEDEDC